jgi:hypothetical protein
MKIVAHMPFSIYWHVDGLCQCICLHFDCDCRLLYTNLYHCGKVLKQLFYKLLLLQQLDLFFRPRRTSSATHLPNLEDKVNTHQLKMLLATTVTHPSALLCQCWLWLHWHISSITKVSNLTRPQVSKPKHLIVIGSNIISNSGLFLQCRFFLESYNPCRCDCQSHHLRNNPQGVQRSIQDFTHGCL